MNLEKQRSYYFDNLRVLACFAVILLHIVAPHITAESLGSKSWWTADVLDSAVRWCVPIFFMLSGSLVLQTTSTFKEDIIKTLYRLVLPFIFISILYFYNTHKIFNMNKFIRLFLEGNIFYHLWYMYVIIGLYLVAPICKVYIQNANKENIRYFLALSLLSSSIYPLFCKIYTISKYSNLILPVVTGYVGFFVLGYYINKFEFKKIVRFTIHFIGLLSFLFIVIATYDLSSPSKLDLYFYEYLSLPVILMSISLFMFFKYNINFKLKGMRFIGDCTFGIYLIHPFIISKLNFSIRMSRLYNNSILYKIFLEAIVVFIICLIIILVLKVSKYILKKVMVCFFQRYLK